MTLGIGIGWGLLLSGLALIFYVYPRRQNRCFGVDTWEHIKIAGEIRRHKRLPESVPGYILKGPYDYPPILHLLLSLFSQRFLERNQFLVSPIISSVHTLLLYLFVYLWTGNPLAATVAVLVFLVTPLVAMENASLNTRSLGSFLFTLATLPMLLGLNREELPLLVASLIMICVVALSHRFSVQALLLFALPFSVIFGTGIPMVLVAAGILLALVISRGFYWKIIRGQWEIIKFWARHGKNRWAHQIYGNNLPNETVPSDGPIPNAIWPSPTQLGMMLHKMVPASLLSYVPFVILLPPLALQRERLEVGVTWPDGISYLLLWCAIFYGTALLITHVRWLRPIGEGYRYLEYLTFPISAIAGVAAGYAGFLGWLWVLVIPAVVFSLYRSCSYLNMVRHNYSQSLTPKLRGILKTIPSGSRVMTLPTYLSDVVAYFSHCQVLYTASDTVYGANSSFYPVLTKPLLQIIKDYDIGYLFVDKEYVTLKNLIGPGESGYQVAVDMPNFCLVATPLLATQTMRA